MRLDPRKFIGREPVTADVPDADIPSAAPRANPGRAGRLGLRFIALGYLALLLLIPVVMIFIRTFEHLWCIGGKGR